MVDFFLKAKPGADPEILRRGGGGGRVNMVRYGILHDHTSKKRKIESTPLYSILKLKHRANVKLTIFLIQTSVKSHIISNNT